MFFVCIGSYAQEPLSYSEVIQAEGMSKRDIYNTAKKWFVTSFNDANSVIQVDNPTDGIVTGKGQFDFIYPGITYAAGSGYVSFIVNFQIKEGRFKVTISDFSHVSLNSDYAKFWSIGSICDKPIYTDRQRRKVWEKVFPKSQEKSKNMIESIKIFFKEKKVFEDDNW